MPLSMAKCRAIFQSPFACVSTLSRERRLIELRDLRELDWDDVVREAGEPTKKAAQQCHARAWARLAARLASELGDDA